MNKISLDAEFEQPRTNPQTPDSELDTSRIIQLGWVVFNETQILEKRCVHINIGVPLSAYIKKLTGITDDDIGTGTTIHSAYELLCHDAAYYNTDRAIVQWGFGDIEGVKREVGDGELWMFGASGRNVKHFFRDWAEMNGVSVSSGLGKSLKKCGLKWDGGDAHNALNDAINTMHIYNFLRSKLK